MIKRKSVIFVAAALLVASAILSGTLAWKSLTQSSISVFEGFVNPGVNLHDDFRTPQKDIFVENSGGDTLYVRVALDEWMKVNNTLITSSKGKLPFFGTDGNDGWLCHNFDGDYANNCGEDFHKYFQWELGDSTLKNAKYYLKAPFKTRALFDSKGTQTREPVVVASSSFEENVEPPIFGINPEYQTASMEEAYLLLETHLLKNYNDSMTVAEYLDSLYSGIANAKEQQDTALAEQLENELSAYIGNPENKLGYYDKVYDVDESGKPTDSFKIVFVPIARTPEVINVLTIDEWISYGRNVGNFWVVDTDGWCYWANPLMPHDATGLLLSAVTAKSSQSENELLYKISATLQAATYEDIETFWLASGIGGGGATEEAKDLLKTISQSEITPQPPISSDSNGENVKTVFSADGSEWLILDQNSPTEKSIVIIKNIEYDIPRANIQTYLDMYINKEGTGSLTNILAADANAVARLLTADEALAFFKSDTDRVALSNSAPADWWLDQKGRVLASGEIATEELAGNAGLRIAVELDSNALKALVADSNK